MLLAACVSWRVVESDDQSLLPSTVKTRDTFRLFLVIPRTTFSAKMILLGGVRWWSRPDLLDLTWICFGTVYRLDTHPLSQIFHKCLLVQLVGGIKAAFQPTSAIDYMFCSTYPRCCWITSTKILYSSPLLRHSKRSEECDFRRLTCYGNFDSAASAVFPPTGVRNSSACGHAFTTRTSCRLSVWRCGMKPPGHAEPGCPHASGRTS